ncbi:hypothetical protein AK37_13404 [Rhodococcus pyridinivorans AK37]|uniref:Uncharacterized protein n=1 Tax=Rhodococcus pyridinivorans AK37 TaxID=1114960 RepID=H0JSM2_9NOCA|nr:hypothetical protein AK37_13404 [Rhodococcus pyridinivorans AK37]
MSAAGGSVRREFTYVHGHLPPGIPGAHGRCEVEGDARFGVRGVLGQIQLEAIEDRREVVGDRLRRRGCARVPDQTVAQTYRTQRPVVGADVVDGDQVQIERDHRGAVLHLRPGERNRQGHDGATGRQFHAGEQAPVRDDVDPSARDIRGQFGGGVQEGGSISGRDRKCECDDIGIATEFDVRPELELAGRECDLARRSRFHRFEILRCSGKRVRAQRHRGGKSQHEGATGTATGSGRCHSSSVFRPITRILQTRRQFGVTLRCCNGTTAGLDFSRRLESDESGGPVAEAARDRTVAAP